MYNLFYVCLCFEKKKKLIYILSIIKYFEIFDFIEEKFNDVFMIVNCEC